MRVTLRVTYDDTGMFFGDCTARNNAAAVVLNPIRVDLEMPCYACNESADFYLHFKARDFCTLFESNLWVDRGTKLKLATY